MKNQLLLSMLVAGVLLASCANENEVVPTTPADQAPTLALNSVEFRSVQSFVNAINSGNRADAHALLTANAGYAYGTGALRTGQAMINWLESDLFSVNARIEIESATQTGNVVTMLGRWGRSGTANNRANYQFTIENGLITTWRLF